LFGYRWLFLDDLRSGKVAFLKPVCDIIEMRHNDCTFIFRSIEEALSSSDLSNAVNMDELRKKLTCLPRNGVWTGLDGMEWRRPVLPRIEESLKRISTSIEPRSILDTEPPEQNNCFSNWENCAFLKKDLVTDRNLVGFENMPLAYKDWMHTIHSSMNFPESEARTIENFKKYYLDGDRNIDGMIWQTLDGSNTKEEVREKEVTRLDTLSDEMEINDHPSQNIPSESDGGGYIQNISGEARIMPSMNETTVSTTTDQGTMSKPSVNLTLEESVSRKRKILNDNELDVSARKESRLSVVTV